MGRPTLFWACLLVTVLEGVTFCRGDVALNDDIKKVTHVLKPGQEKHIDEDYDFQMFCRIGEKKYAAYYFRTATLRITSSAEDIKLIKGHTPRDVYLQYTQSTKWLLWIANVLPWRARDTHFPTFNTSCVGISTTRPYTAMTIIRPVDPWKVLTLAAGIGLFFMAPRLSHSTLFFYSSGTLLGGVAAALVLLFILQRFLPKGKTGYLLMSVVWSMAFYFAGETWKQFEELVHERLPYIVAYLFTGALLSFLACYRWGPPQHPKTLNIITWCLQVTGLVLIHFSSDFVEMSTAIILLIIAYHHCHTFLMYYLERYYRRWFPPPHRLLSEEEYITQGVIETQKGLAELKSFCSSPEAKPWQLVARLNNPRRFSSFIEGGSHLNDDECLAYDNEEPHYLTNSAPRAAISFSNMPTNSSFVFGRNGATMMTSTSPNNMSSRPPQNEMVVTDDEESTEERVVDESLETDDDD